MKRASRTGANMRAVSAMELAEMRRHSARVRACAEALALPNRRAENPVRYGVLFLTPQEPGRAGFSNSFQHGGAPKFSAIRDRHRHAAVRPFAGESPFRLIPATTSERDELPDCPVVRACLNAADDQRRPGFPFPSARDSEPHR